MRTYLVSLVLIVDMVEVGTEIAEVEASSEDKANRIVIDDAMARLRQSYPHSKSREVTATETVRVRGKWPW